MGSSDTREGIEQTEASTGMCTYNNCVPLVYRAPVAKEAHEEAPKLGGATSDTGKLGPLKVALGNIPALCANHEVRLRPLLTTVISLQNF